MLSSAGAALYETAQFVDVAVFVLVGELLRLRHCRTLCESSLGGQISWYREVSVGGLQKDFGIDGRGFELEESNRENLRTLNVNSRDLFGVTRSQSEQGLSPQVVAAFHVTPEPDEDAERCFGG